MQTKFTAEASQFWGALPDEHKQAIVTNVWCGSCSHETTIVNFRDKMENGTSYSRVSAESVGSRSHVLWKEASAG